MAACLSVFLLYRRQRLEIWRRYATSMGGPPQTRYGSDTTVHASRAPINDADPADARQGAAMSFFFPNNASSPPIASARSVSTGSSGYNRSHTDHRRLHGRALRSAPPAPDSDAATTWPAP